MIQLLKDTIARGQTEKRGLFGSLSGTIGLIYRRLDAGKPDESKATREANAELFAQAEALLRDCYTTLNQQVLEDGIKRHFAALHKYLRRSQRHRDQSEYDSLLMGFDEFLSTIWMLERFKRTPLEVEKLVESIHTGLLGLRQRYGAAKLWAVDNYAKEEAGYANVTLNSINLFGVWQQLVEQAKA